MIYHIELISWYIELRFELFNFILNNSVVQLLDFSSNTFQLSMYSVCNVLIIEAFNMLTSQTSQNILICDE